jgi:uncharacterized protein YbjQ (UPF0145 family)
MHVGRSGAQDAEPDARAEASLRSLEAGGLPVAAQERLANLRSRGGSFYTSDLSTNEFLLIRQAGFKPVSQVMGSCYYSIGWQAMPWSGYGSGGYGRGGYATGPGAGWSPSAGELYELDVEIEAWTEARQRALGRLAQEAKLAGADAVVGVRLSRGTHEWSHGMIEFVATGTAVRSERYELGDEPVLSNLSGQEFAKLFAAGYWPAGLVADTTVLYVLTGWNQKMGTSWYSPNQELKDFTQGVQHARRLSVDRAARDARQFGAAGMVGVTLDVSQREHERDDASDNKFKDMIVTVHALGTAIVELQGGEDPPVYIALQMNEES